MKKKFIEQAEKKLISETGASILIALLVFLIAAMTGSVILTSATVSSGALNRMEQSEQDTDVLKSAAGVLIDGFSNQVDIIADSENFSDGLKSISDIQKYMGQEVMKSGSADYTISSMKVDSSDENIQKAVEGRTVKAELTMDSSYRISIDLSFSGKANGSHLYVAFTNDPVDVYTDDTHVTISQKGAQISTVKGAQ